VRIMMFSPLLVAILLSTAFAEQTTDEGLEQSILVILKARHPKNQGDWWRGLGPRAPSVMMSLYQSSGSIYHRIRLIEALRWFTSPEVSDFLKHEAERNPNPVIQETAIRSLGVSQGLKEKDFLEKSLQNKNPRTRAAAAQALSALTEDGSMKQKTSSSTARIPQSQTSQDTNKKAIRIDRIKD
jgi:hypothetical protein